MKKNKEIMFGYDVLNLDYSHFSTLDKFTYFRLVDSRTINLTTYSQYTDLSITFLW